LHEQKKNLARFTIGGTTKIKAEISIGIFKNDHNKIYEVEAINADVSQRMAFLIIESASIEIYFLLQVMGGT